MDYTREPIVETVLTPKEGCKLVVRNSKGAGTEEFFVDALEVVSFGNSFFFRSLERPKSFLLPVTDYEVLEVREPRMAFKHSGVGGSIKIGGGRESKGSKSEASKDESDDSAPVPVEPKKRERRRSYRRRRGQEDKAVEEGRETPEDKAEEPAEAKPAKPAKESRRGSKKGAGEKKAAAEAEGAPVEAPSLMVAPPPKLISESISQYKESGLYADAFFEEGEEGAAAEPAEKPKKRGRRSKEAGESPERFRGQEQSRGNEAEPDTAAGNGVPADTKDVGQIDPLPEGIEEKEAEKPADNPEAGELEIAPPKKERMSFADIVEELSDKGSS